MSQRSEGYQLERDSKPSACATSILRIVPGRHSANFITVGYTQLINALMQANACQDVIVQPASPGLSAGIMSSTLRRSRHAHACAGAISKD